MSNMLCSTGSDDNS